MHVAHYSSTMCLVVVVFPVAVKGDGDANLYFVLRSYITESKAT